VSTSRVACPKTPSPPEPPLPRADHDGLAFVSLRSHLQPRAGGLGRGHHLPTCRLFVKSIRRCPLSVEREVGEPPPGIVLVRLLGQIPPANDCPGVVTTELHEPHAAGRDPSLSSRTRHVR